MRSAALALLFTLGVASADPTQAGPQAMTLTEATYVLRSSSGAPDGSVRTVTESVLVLQWEDGAWTGTCSGTATTDAYGVVTTESFSQDSPMPPPRMPARLHRGQAVDPDLLLAASQGCRHDLQEVVVAGHARDGSRTMVATEPEGASAYQAVALAWDARSGLVVSWSFAGGGGGFEGHLVQAGPR